MPNPDGTPTKDEATLMVCRNAWSYREAEKNFTDLARGAEWHAARRECERARKALDGALDCLSGIVRREKEAEAARIAAHAPAEQRVVA